MADSDRIVLGGAAPLPRSLWAATARPAIPAPPLTGATEADAVVVGGGFTGLSAALHLAERGWKPVLLEAAEPGWGASGRNGGQIIAGLKANPAEIIAKMVEGRLRKFYEEVVLLEQVYVIDPEKKVGKVIEAAAKEIGAPVEVVAIARYQLGEGIEKRQDDFAAEVAAAAGTGKA